MSKLIQNYAVSLFSVGTTGHCLEDGREAKKREEDRYLEFLIDLNILVLKL